MPPTMSGAPDSPPRDVLLLLLPAVDVTGEKAPGTMAASQPGAAGGKKVQRVWSEADEVRILEGLAAYAATHGAPPARSQLHAALQGRGLDKAEFTVTEIYEKVRRLRTKYGNLRAAGGPSVPAGDDGDGDEVRKYELSAAIWGDQPLNVAKKGGKIPDAADAAAPEAAGGTTTRVRRGFEELQGMFPCLAVAVERITSDEVAGPGLKRAFELITDQEAGVLDAKLKKHMVKEVQMQVNQTAVRKELLKMLISSAESNDKA